MTSGLCDLLRQLARLKGAHVFQYVDEDGTIHHADAVTVNDYLRERTGHPLLRRIFAPGRHRHWRPADCSRISDAETLRARKKIIKSTIAEVANALGNTTTVCRKYYIHSGLLESV